MQHAWENVLTLELAVDRVESNPQLVQIIPANEVIVLISFELTVGETRGMMNLCIPFNSIERISGKLTANSWVSYSKRPPSPQSMQRIGNRIAEAPVEVVVELADHADHHGRHARPARGRHHRQREGRPRAAAGLRRGQAEVPRRARASTRAARRSRSKPATSRRASASILPPNRVEPA